VVSVCMRDVKEVHTTVCRQLPSAFLCVKGGCWTYESGMSSPLSVQRVWAQLLLTDTCCEFVLCDADARR